MEIGGAKVGHSAREKRSMLTRITGSDSVLKGCELEGISKATYYRWRKKLEKDGLSGLREKSRRPIKTNAIESDVRAIVVELAKSEGYRSANAISIKMSELGSSISRNTVIKILKQDYQYPIYYLLPTGEWRFWNKVKILNIVKQ